MTDDEQTLIATMRVAVESTLFTIAGERHENPLAVSDQAEAIRVSRSALAALAQHPDRLLSWLVAQRETCPTCHDKRFIKFYPHEAIEDARSVPCPDCLCDENERRDQCAAESDATIQTLKQRVFDLMGERHGESVRANQAEAERDAALTESREEPCAWKYNESEVYRILPERNDQEVEG